MLCYNTRSIYIVRPQTTHTHERTLTLPHIRTCEAAALNAHLVTLLCTFHICLCMSHDSYSIRKVLKSVRKLIVSVFHHRIRCVCVCSLQKKCIIFIYLYSKYIHIPYIYPLVRKIETCTFVHTQIKKKTDYRAYELWSMFVRHFYMQLGTNKTKRLLELQYPTCLALWRIEFR